MSALSQPEDLIFEIDSLNNLAGSLSHSDTQKAIELANLALSKSEETNYPKGIALAKKNLGDCYITFDNNEQGVQYYLEANEMFKASRDKLNGAIVFIKLGDNFFSLSDYDNALKCYKVSYDLNLKITHESGMAEALIGMATVYYTTGQNDLSLKVLLESEKFCKKNKLKEILVKIHHGLGETYYNLKKYDKAILYFGSCTALCKELKLYNTEASAYDGMAKTYTTLGRYEDAIDNYDISLKLRKTNNFKIDEAETLKNIGKVYIKLKDNKKAINYLLEANNIAIQVKSNKGIYKSAKKLADLYELEEKPAESLKYYKLFLQAIETERNLKAERLAKSFELQNKVLQSQAEKAIIKERGKEQQNFSESLTLLSRIGQQIISSFNVETIVKAVYDSVNTLMDATGFGIGLYQKSENTIMFPLFIEGEDKFENAAFDIDDDNRLAVVCYKTSKEIIINDFKNEIGKYIQQTQTPKAGKDVESLIYLPLIYKETLFGVITVQSFKKHAYSNYHLNILKNLATYTAIALENAKLYNQQELKVVELEKTFENTRLVSEIGKEISSTFLIQEIISKVYNSVNKLMDATMFGIGIYDPKTKHIIFSGVMENAETLKDYFYSLNNVDRPAVWCFTNQKEYVINNFTEEFVNKNKITDIKILEENRTESVIYVPLTQNNKKIGVITVQSYTPNVYTDYHLQLLKSIAVYTAIAIDNASLYNNMEQIVAERTHEVIQQKELLEKNFNDIKISAQISKDIASSFSVETIVEKVYDNVKSVLNAESFGIGIYDSATQSLRFEGFIKRGEQLPPFEFFLNEKDRYEIVCYKNEREIIINDNKVEYIKYIKSVEDDSPDSQVYIPLYTKEKKIGVLTAQSYRKNAFQEYQVHILKNIALSVATALDNANLYQNLEQKVEERSGEIHKQKVLIEEKNKDITDSIKYAKIIQQTIAPNIDEFNKNFSDSFILYKPKDIVSGDFYWFEHFGETTVFAVADCTGHGVPGAFMSLICNEIMDNVINEQKIQDPAKALTLIDEKLVRLLKKSSEATANDGMEIALCTYEKRYKIISYSGAHRPLMLIRDKEIIEYKPNIFSIGGQTTVLKHFEMTEIKVRQGDIIYLLTDGFVDQFGGDKGKKFMLKNFKDLVIDICDKPMKEQKEILDETFENWRGTSRQVDDVCVIGVRI